MTDTVWVVATHEPYVEAAFTSEADAKAHCRRCCQGFLAEYCDHIKPPYPEDLGELIKLVARESVADVRYFMQEVELNPSVGAGLETAA
jgi:hypothetical protein